MHHKFAAILCAALVSLVMSASALAVEKLPDPQLEATAQRLESQLRCLVCQNQSIAESTADLANDLRNQVRTQLSEGKTEQQIIDYMTDRYGAFVLYDPPFNFETFLLWCGPALLLLIALGGFFLTLRGRRKTASTTSLSAEERARAAELLNQPKSPSDS